MFLPSLLVDVLPALLRTTNPAHLLPYPLPPRSLCAREAAEPVQQGRLRGGVPRGPERQVGRLQHSLLALLPAHCAAPRANLS